MTLLLGLDPLVNKANALMNIFINQTTPLIGMYGPYVIHYMSINAYICMCINVYSCIIIMHDLEEYL